MRYPVVFFDLDGTLTDSTEGITSSVRHALDRLGVRIGTDRLRAFVGPPLDESFRHPAGLDGETAARAVALYREYFEVRGIYENRVFEGVPDLLGRLHDGGRALSVVTSKPVVYAEEILRHFRLRERFESVVGPGLDLGGSEKQLLVAEAPGRHAGRSREDFVMVGDREHDIHGAAANGIASAGVTWGAGTRDELEGAGATHIVESVAELGAMLSASVPHVEETRRRPEAVPRTTGLDSTGPES